MTTMQELTSFSENVSCAKQTESSCCYSKLLCVNKAFVQPEKGGGGGGEAIMYRYLQGWKYTRSVECCILQILSSIMETGKSHTHTHAHTRTSRPETRGQCYRGEHSPAQLSFRGNTHEGLCWWQDEDTHRYVNSLPHPTILSRLIPGQ